ncbi:MAG: ankyrin repeat domain-containing protein [Armatimonadota bacterium]
MRSALRSAVVARDIETVRNLLASGAAVNETGDYGWTALMLAVKYKQLEIVRLLMAHSADTELYNSHGKAALHHAIDGDDAASALALLQGGTSPDLPLRNRIPSLHTPDESIAPLVQATILGKTEVLRLLIEFGAEVNARNTSGETVLIIALRRGKRRVAKLLIQQEADVNAMTHDGTTPLMLAQSQAMRAIRLLLENAGAK